MSTTTIEEQLAQLEATLHAAEHALADDAPGDGTNFARAVVAELESWDADLERLQTAVATLASHAREQAEAEIAHVRSRRIALGQRLAPSRATST